MIEKCTCGARIITARLFYVRGARRFSQETQKDGIYTLMLPCYNYFMDSITLKVHAKLNLTLEITGVNERGYHELDMICCSVSPHDEVRVKKADKISVTMDGKPAGEENTAYRAAVEVMKACGRALCADIKKGIPAGAGMGGSSADASAVFYAAVKLELIDENTAEKLCVKVGSDVAYMMKGGYCRLQGEGEKITPLGEIDFRLAVVQKEVGASTAEVYKGYDEEPYKGLGVTAVLRGERYYNVLEKPAVRMCPSIYSVKDRLLKLFGNACMTGSGSAVFSVAPACVDEEAFKEKFADCAFAEIVETVPEGIEVVSEE